MTRQIGLEPWGRHRFVRKIALRTGLGDHHAPVKDGLCRTLTLLKRVENPTEKQTARLSELLKCNLRTVLVYLLREDFQRFWEYRGPSWAGRCLEEWTRRVM